MIFGYMTAKEARSHGFTHHGSYFGIPVWITPEDAEPMDHVMTVAHYVEGFLRSTMFPYDEPGFQFSIGKRIEEPK